MNYPSKRAYYENENNNNAKEPCYTIGHKDAIYTKDDESETLGTKLTEIETNITSNSNKIGDLSGAGLAETDLATAIKNDRTSLSELANQNLLINGGIQVWRRGTSFIAPSTGMIYTADRWGIASSDNTSMLSQYQDGIKLATVANARYWFGQPIELTPSLAGVLSGSKITLSFWVRADVAFSAKATYGVNATAPVDTNGITYDITTSYVKKIITFTVPTLQFTDSYLHIIPFRIDSAIQSQLPATNIYIKQVKLEIGSIATPFVPRPYAEELVLCQRYYENIQFSFRPMTNTTTGIAWDIPYQFVKKRIIPTIGNLVFNDANNNVLTSNLSCGVYSGNNVNFWSQYALTQGTNYTIKCNLDSEIY